jgi:hypothetical protein
MIVRKTTLNMKKNGLFLEMALLFYSHMAMVLTMVKHISMNI